MNAAERGGSSPPSPPRCFPRGFHVEERVAMTMTGHKTRSVVLALTRADRRGNRGPHLKRLGRVDEKLRGESGEPH